MNSARVLNDRYGIGARLENGCVFFSGVGKCLSSVTGNEAAFREVHQLMVDVEENCRKYLQQDERIIVDGDRQIIVLYPGEVRRLLQRDPDLYMKALKRGKSELRYRQNERRTATNE